MSSSQDSLLLWNMGFCAKGLNDAVKRSRIELLEAMVAERSPSIIALQEAPPELDRTSALRLSYDIIEGPKGITSAFLKTRWDAYDRREDKRRRSLGVKVDSKSRRARLWVWNVHLPVLHIDIGKRRDILLCELLDQIKRARTADPDRHELIAGDFNLPPYDGAIVCRSGLHANRSHKWVLKANPKDIMGRRLFNPTWALLGRSQSPCGSFYNDHLTDGPWLVPDQAIMSARLGLPGEPQVHLVDRVRHADGTETDLCTGLNRSPNKSVGSDHLPLCIEFQAA